MSHTLENITIAGRTCSIYLPPSVEEKPHGVLYVHDGKQFVSTFQELLPTLEESCLNNLPIIVALQSLNRLNEYTPWPKEALDPKFPPFGGLGDDYLTHLTQEIKPYIDANYSTLSDPANTGILGFSLGGLISIYAAYTKKEFGIIGSISGSFWYDGWVEYLKSQELTNPNLKIYLSSGRNEGLNKDNLRQKAAEATIATQQALSKVTGHEINVVWDDGGHHDLRLKRHAAALEWINKQYQNLSS